MTPLLFLITVSVTTFSCGSASNINDWKLAFATSDNVFMITSENGMETVPARVGPRMNKSAPFSIGCDVRNKVVYWSDVISDGEKILKISYDSESPSNEIIADSGLYMPDGTAYDWITGNLYMTDSTYRHIFVCGKVSNLCSVLVEEAQGSFLKSVALHPNVGLMYWTDWGLKPAILRAGMDGSNKQIIISENLHWPNGLCLDLATPQGSERMYWAEVVSEKIESAKLDGSDRKLVTSRNIVHPVGIDVVGDRVFWSDWQFFDIKSVNKVDGSDQKVHVAFTKSVVGNRINGLTICHESKQVIKRSNPCNNANCSHICTLSPTRDFHCTCPVGMALFSDGRTCLESITTPKLVLASNSAIKLMRFGSVGKNILDTIQFVLELKEISAIVYNPLDHTVFISDKAHKTIFEYNHNKKEMKVLVDKHIRSVTTMDIDIVSENLYWADESKKTVEVISLRTKERAVLMTGIENPLDILVVPEIGSFYLSSYGSLGGKVEKVSLNGNGSSIIRWLPGMEPVALKHYRDDEGFDTVVWVDRVIGKVESSGFHGTFESPIANFSRLLGPLSDAAIHDGKVYWLDGSLPADVKFTSLSDSTSQKVGSIPLRTLVKYSKMSIFNKNISDLYNLIHSHECSPKNYNRKVCSHLCLPTGEENKGECLCPEGLLLNGDKLNCDKPASCSSNQFTCNDGTCISKTFLCDGDQDCTENEDEKNCSPSASSICAGGLFMCNSRQMCIKLDAVCDSQNDCQDESDEDINLCADKSQICSASEFKCGVTGTCISNKLVCDGISHCKFSEDEIGGCFNSEKGKITSHTKEEGGPSFVVTTMLVLAVIFIIAGIGYVLYRKVIAPRMHIHTVPYACSGHLFSNEEYGYSN